jgi:hypothetical protein
MEQNDAQNIPQDAQGLKNLKKVNAERAKDQKRKKELFLVSYEKNGTFRAACEFVKLPRNTVWGWLRDDLEFTKAYEGAKHSFAEGLEGIALDRIRNPDKNRGSDVLLIALLNANMPAKYRPQVAINEDSAKELIFEWRKAAQNVKQENVPVVSREAELSVNLQDTLVEILEKRKEKPVEENEGKEG